MTVNSRFLEGKSASLLLLFLALGWILPLLPLSVLAGSRSFLSQNQWFLSHYEKTAIQRAGYDYAPTVMSDASGYQMWWCGSAPSGNPYIDHIWTSRSTDGLNWNPPEVALTPAPLALISDPSVVRIAGLYYMYFTGTRDPQGTSNEVYLANSPDGKIWKKYPDDNNPRPVLALSSITTGYGVGQPSVLFLQNRFWLYYTDSTKEGGGLFLASSSDGIHFSPENEGKLLLATNSADVKFSETLHFYIMVHGNSHDKLYYSSSTDGIHWQPIDSWHYLAHSASKNKAFEGCIAGSPTGTFERWTFYYYASHQGIVGKIEDPMSWDIDMGRLSFSAPPPLSTVFQYHTQATESKGYFYSTVLETPPLYEYEHRSYLLSIDSSLGLLPFFRLYHPSLQDHFYTINSEEKKTALAMGYRDEGVLGYIAGAILSNTTPLFRLYHPLGAHFYTTNLLEKEQHIANGFHDEGIGGHVWPLVIDSIAGALTVSPASVSAGVPGLTPPTIVVSFDQGSTPGAFDSRLEISYANQPFQGNNPLITDSQARISTILTGNQGKSSLLLEGFPEGRYSLRMAALDENGQAASLYGPLTTLILSSAPDQPPFGWLDYPREKGLFDQQLQIQGWALDDRNVSRVSIYVDDLWIGDATQGLGRADVRSVYPAYAAADRSGFRYDANLSNLSPGAHRISVVLLDSAGHKISLGPRNIQKTKDYDPPPFGVIDLPLEGGGSDGNLMIQGWALDDKGVKGVQLMIDDKVVGNASWGDPRPDVQTAFPGYPNAEISGYRLETNISTLATGTHRLLALLTDTAKQISIIGPRAFLVINGGNKPPFGDIDYPVDGSMVTSTMDVSGWALDDRGIPKVELTLDGSVQREVPLGKLRTGVASLYPTYPNNLLCGFTITLDTSSWALGKHALSIRLWDKQGLRTDVPPRNIVKYP